MYDDISLSYYRQSLVEKANKELAYNSPCQDVNNFNVITKAIDEKVSERRREIESSQKARISAIKARL